MENKYIIINNIHELKILEHRMKSIGFCFNISIEKMIEFVENADGYDKTDVWNKYEGYEEHLDYRIDEKMILVFTGLIIFYRRFKFKDDYNDWNKYEYYNVQKLLRQEKLSRIFEED